MVKWDRPPGLSIAGTDVCVFLESLLCNRANRRLSSEFALP